MKEKRYPNPVHRKKERPRKSKKTRTVLCNLFEIQQALEGGGCTNRG